MVFMANWYDYPQYFDLAFADETPTEVEFVEAACGRYALGKVSRILEIGCGGGRLVVELARRGFEMVAFDNNAVSLAYVRRRLSRRKLSAELFSAEMGTFAVGTPVDVALNTFNTFRHLTTEDAALSHLRCVARSLRRGGIFILGLHVMPPDAADESTERWTARRGKTKVVFTLRVLSTNNRRRLEQMRATMLVRSPRRELRLQTDFPLRRYSARQLRQLLAKVPQLELCEVFDFWYEIDRPLRLNENIADTVLVLRKR